jgi:hypothetical protein
MSGIEVVLAGQPVNLFWGCSCSGEFQCGTGTVKNGEKAAVWRSVPCCFGGLAELKTLVGF